MTRIPRIIIAGTHSGCGKTTTASGIMAALKARGLAVQPFKVGPDFIDPSHHTAVCKRQSRNLDPFMMGEDNLLRTFESASEGADIAVIEGVMGLFDGIDAGEISSTAHVAKILDAPVILVVDVKGMSRSAAALIKGYTEFDPDVKFAGVILTKGGSEKHRAGVCGALNIPVFGWIPKSELMSVESRHLGLFMAGEDSKLSETASFIEEHCDLDAITAAANIAGDLPKTTFPNKTFPKKAFAGADAAETGAASDADAVKIAVAMDDAFCFYYRDNFDYLRAAGAQTLFFSPLTDKLPDADAYYFGGGYPELHLQTLQDSPCKNDLKKAADAGVPVFGECGGLMWLGRSITTADGKTFKTAGLLDSDSVMHTRFQALDYSIGTTCGSSFLEKGLGFRGHEFHYSKTSVDSDARFDYRLSRGKGIDGGRDGLVCGSVLAGYTHMYFGPEVAVKFVEGIKKIR